ncbi:MAG: diheme cytochrome c-553 [Bacteroidia bacterium]|nr:diheme cytochrome c-553 [Bacteroidia bacterium]
MKKVTFLIIAAYLASASSCQQGSSSPATEEKLVTEDSLIKKGEYLVGVMGCDDCHSPKVMGPQGPMPDPALRFSGHPSSFPLVGSDTSVFSKGWMLFALNGTAAFGPWGTSYAANLTSDPTGIGNWTEEQFNKAMREGKYKGMDNTRPLLPPMPWPNFRNLSKEDMKAIFLFLKSTPPVKNVVPAPVPPGGQAS